MAEDKPLVTIKEAAQYLGVHYNTIWKMVISGQLEARRVGIQWRIPREALLKDIDGKKPEKK